MIKHETESCCCIVAEYKINKLATGQNGQSTWPCMYMYVYMWLIRRMKRLMADKFKFLVLLAQCCCVNVGRMLC